MKPISITLKNYKRYGNEEVTLDLTGNKVRVVTGKMGSGKTSFVDAIIWSLFGKSLSSVDGVVNRQNKKNCKVEFQFQVNTDEYSIIRYRKHDEYKNNVLLFKNNKNISGSDNKKTQQLIEDTIGITYRAIVSSVIFSSEIYISFLRSKGYTERLKILENILNLGIVNKWLDNTKKLIKPINEKIEEYEQKISKVDYGIETIEKNIEDYKENSKKKLVELKRRKDELTEQVKELNSKLEEMNDINVEEEIEKVKNFNSIKENNDYINNKIQEEESTLYDLNKILENINNLRAKKEYAERINIDQEIKEQKEYNQNIANKKEEESKISDLKSKLKDIDSVEKEIKSLDSKIESLNSEIADLEHKEKCPLCQQEITKEKSRELIDLKTEELQNCTHQKSEKEKTLKENKKENEKLKDQIANIEYRMPKVEEKTFDRTIEELEELKEKKNSIDNEIKSGEADYEQKKEWNSKILSKINSLKLELKEEGDEPFHDLDFLNNIKENKESLFKEKAEKENEINNIVKNVNNVYDKEYVNGLKDKISKLKSSKTKNLNHKNKKEEELEYYKFFNSLFANKEGGIKKEVIGRMIQAFNKKVNHYIPYFMPNDRSGITIEFDQNLKETIKENDEEVEYDTFSSGEKTVLELSVAFSLFMLAKEFFSSSISFIVFDEILDGNLDSEASAKVAKVVSDLGESNSIIVISHRVDLKESFDHQVLIDKDKKGFSYIKSIS